MALAATNHFYFRSGNGRYRAHVGTKGALVMASCQGVARLKMDTQKLMVERKHFGLKFHLLPNSREMVELILFTNRAEVKEVRLKVDGAELLQVSEKMYRADTDGSASGIEPGAATLVQAPPGMGLAGDLNPPSNLPDPEKDDVLDRLAILTGSGKHPAVGRVSETVTLPPVLPPAGALRIDPADDMVPPPLAENAPTPAHSIPAVEKPKPEAPTRKAKPARSGKEPAAKSAVQGTPPAKAAKIEPAASPAPAKTPPAAKSPPVAKSGADPAVKVNKNAVAPAGDLQVPDGLDDLLDLDDGDKGKA